MAAENKRKTIHRKQGKKVKRKKNRKLYYAFLVILAIATVVVLSLTVFFKINTFSVKGNNFYTDEEIIDMIDIEKDTNLFLAKVTHLPEIIEKEFPYLEQVTVHKMIPSTIEVRVVPSEVSAIVEIEEDISYALMSKNGKILEIGIPQIPPEIVLVRNFDISGKQPGDYLGEYEKEVIEKADSDSLEEVKVAKNKEMEAIAESEREFLRVIEYLEAAVEETGFKKITNLDFADPYNIKAVYEDRIIIELGTEMELAYKLKYIEDAIKSQDKNARGTLSVENIMLKGESIFTPYVEPVTETSPDLKITGDGDREPDLLEDDTGQASGDSGDGEE